MKSWLARELKLKQPQKLTEAMRMAENLEVSFYTERKPFKEGVQGIIISKESLTETIKCKGAHGR